MKITLKRGLYDQTKINAQKKLFSNKDLRILLIPLIVEQFLNSLMGMVDTMMVSNIGSTAISAVSLVDAINNLIVQLFAAMAAGATIVCSQYLGRKDRENSNKTAKQVVIAMLAISCLITVIGIGQRTWLLQSIFGTVEDAVMEQSMTYFFITALSYPFLALFSAGSAFYRAGGNSRFPMRISVTANLINIIGNIILIFGFKKGVAGAALATLISRMFCTGVIFYFLHKPNQPIVIDEYGKIRLDLKRIARVLAIGLPAGIENGMFQFGKLAIQSTVSKMGTVAMAAQAMTNILENVNGIAGAAVGIGLMTVVGQCMGAGRKEEAKYYIVKLTVYAEVLLTLSCLFAMLITKPATLLGGMEEESAKLCFNLMLAITVVKPLVWTLSFVPAYGMRAAGDVKFSMTVSTLTMWFCRVALVIYLFNVWGLGPIAVWIGIFMDWTVRAFIFSIRFLRGKWLEKEVI